MPKRHTGRASLTCSVEGGLGHDQALVGGMVRGPKGDAAAALGDELEGRGGGPAGCEADHPVRVAGAHHAGGQVRRQDAAAAGRAQLPDVDLLRGRRRDGGNHGSVR